MEITVELFQENIDAGNPKVYVIQLNTCDTSWSVLKRFTDLHSLHKVLLPTIRNYPHFPKFPKRQLGGSYNQKTLETRKIRFTIWLEAILRTSCLHTHRAFQTFIQSDIYLESYHDLKKSQTLRIQNTTAHELKSRINTQMDLCETFLRDVEIIKDQGEIIMRNLNELNKTNETYIESLQYDNSRSLHIPHQLVSSIDDTKHTLYEIREDLEVTALKKQQVGQSIGNFRQTVLTLRDEVNSLDSKQY